MTHAQAIRYTVCTVAPTVYLGLGALHGDPFNWIVFYVAVMVLILNVCWDGWHFDDRL